MPEEDYIAENDATQVANIFFTFVGLLWRGTREFLGLACKAKITGATPGLASGRMLGRTTFLAKKKNVLPPFVVL